MKRKQYPLIYWWISGSIGKRPGGFVIKQYKYGPVKTKYPDMTKVIASASQRKCRNLFKEAVAFAKTVIADPVKKEEWRKRIRRKNRVFVQVVRFYMPEAKRNLTRKKQAVEKLIRKCFEYAEQEINVTTIATLPAGLQKKEFNLYLLNRNEINCST